MITFHFIIIYLKNKQVDEKKINYDSKILGQVKLLIVKKKEINYFYFSQTLSFKK